MTKEALKLALEALELEEAQTHYPTKTTLTAIKAVKEALNKGWVGLDDVDLAGCTEEEYTEARYWEKKLREKNNV